MAKDKIIRFKKEIIVALVFLSLFFVSRLINLTIIPIFVDEAIYLRWAQIARDDASWRFISLTDGKQPLFIWLAMVVMKIISDPLVAGRLVSVGAGFTSLVGIWFLTKELFGKKEAFWASFIYLVSPIYLLYDRMALTDSLLASFGIWSLYFGILLVRHLRLDIAFVLGIVLGGAFLTKSPSIFYLYLLGSTVLFFDFRKRGKAGFLKWVVLFLIAYLHSQTYFNIMRLSPWFHMIKIKDADFVRSFSEVIKAPFSLFPGNLGALRSWAVSYLTFPLAFLACVSFFLGMIRKSRSHLVLAAYFLVPLFSMAIFGKVIYARYLVYCIFPLLVLVAALLPKIFSLFKNKVLLVVLFLLIFSFPLYFDYFLLTNPPKAPIPTNDKAQYIDDWPSGYGVKEIVAYVKKEAVDKEVVVVTEGTFGLMPYSLELYLVGDKNIEVFGLFPVKEIPPQVLIKAEERPVYFVFNETQKIPSEWPLELIAKYPKGNKRVFMKLFKVKPK